MLGGIEGIMNLAAASGEDLATTSDIVTDALTAFGLSANDAGHFADAFFEPLLSALQYLLETIWQAIQILIEMALDAISAKVQEIWNGIVAFLTPILEGISSFFQSIWAAITNTVSNALNAIRTAVTNA